jgi:hypothetical protein
MQRVHQRVDVGGRACSAECGKCVIAIQRLVVHHVTCGAGLLTCVFDYYRTRVKKPVLHQQKRRGIFRAFAGI